MMELERSWWILEGRVEVGGGVNGGREGWAVEKGWRCGLRASSVYATHSSVVVEPRQYESTRDLIHDEYARWIKRINSSGMYIPLTPHGEDEHQ